MFSMSLLTVGLNWLRLNGELGETAAQLEEAIAQRRAMEE